MTRKDRGRYAFTAKRLCYTAVMVVVICLCAWISIPIGDIPISLQFFGVCLAVGLLGWKFGTLAVLAYVLLGGIGVPVFAGFTGGLGKFVLPTGGYLIGMSLGAPVMGWIIAKHRTHFYILVLGAVVALLICYTVGVVWFSLWITTESVGLITALTTFVLPFLPFDVLKILTASWLIKRLYPKLKID